LGFFPADLVHAGVFIFEPFLKKMLVIDILL